MLLGVFAIGAFGAAVVALYAWLWRHHHILVLAALVKSRANFSPTK